MSVDFLPRVHVCVIQQHFSGGNGQNGDIHAVARGVCAAVGHVQSHTVQLHRMGA